MKPAYFDLFVLSFCFLWIVTFPFTAGFRVSTLSDFDEKIARASCEFALKLLKHEESQNNSSNVVFSPAGIGTLLSVLQQGAKGNTAKELEKLLGLTADESQRGLRRLLGLKKEKNVTLEWGNRCYVKSELELIDDYQKVIENNFDVEIEKMDFGVPTSQDSADKMNEWVKEVTHDKIKNFIDSSSISTETILVMINAIFFKGNWAKPFKKGKTVVDEFQTSPEESVHVPFMSQREKYYSDKNASMGAKWVQQPFQNERFSMVFILPTRRHNLNHLLSKMTADDLYFIFTHIGVSHVKLRIPKFNVFEKVSLVETLEELGLRDIFTSASDLSGIATAGLGLAVSDMMHEANVEIDEKGGSGSAATVVEFLRMRTPTMSFVADQPFLFFIIDETTKIPLFAGKVVNPKT